jgi:DNA modification methylase
MTEPVLQHLPIDDLLPYARNAKKHPPEQIAQIASSIKEFGFNAPVLVDGEQGIIAGHGRVLAARKLGLATIPCIILTHLTPAQKRAYIIADNRLGDSALAPWDWEMLQAEIDQLKEENYDYTLTGFTDESLAAAVEAAAAEFRGDPEESGRDTEPQTDRAEELRVKWGVNPGDLWQLGDHRLLCGDSTKAEDVARVLQGDVPLLMVTDPPYGVEYDAEWRGKAGHATMGKNRTGKVESDNRADWREAWQLFSGDVAYVWHGGLHAAIVAESLVVSGFDLRSQIIWNKSVMVMGRGDYHWKHEPCWYAVRHGKTGRWNAGRDQTTVWDLASPIHIMSGSKEEKTEHPTQKPLECMARPIRNHDSPLVYEPFSGSGTTIIACENLGRKCRAIEISPGYVAVTLERYFQHTGNKPVLAQ